ncbi:Lrp/AsnC ligand binding domain-containing protein [Candidatus Woesearchaeota archaeon]|nr:Lrp/AsnC ligand binding domain-containing protein [Candidatus Woesearchaeota archaeon]
MNAYVLIALADCDEQVVLEELQGFPEVKEAHILFGEWDLIAKLEVENPEAAGTFVMEHIRKLEDVKLTSTLIVAR